MKCTIELLSNPWRERSIVEALKPSEEDLARNPRSALFVRNSFFERLDTITETTLPNATKRHEILINCLRDLSTDVFNTANVPPWGIVTDFQNLQGVPNGEPPQIYMNANMDSSYRWVIVFSSSIAVTIKKTEDAITLYRTNNKQPYKLKTLLKDLGVR